LNTEFDHYPIANKILATAHAEQTSTAEIVCFLDSDKYVLSPIEALLLPSDATIGLRPVNRKGPGSSGTNDPNDAYWQALISDHGLNSGARVQTVVGGEIIRPYYNAGFVMFRRIFFHGRHWLKVLTALESQQRFPEGNKRCMDQIALAVVAGKSPGATFVLHTGINFPLPFTKQLRDSESFDWPKIVVSVHYYRFHASPHFDVWLRMLGIHSKIRY